VRPSVPWFFSAAQAARFLVCTIHLFCREPRRSTDFAARATLILVQDFLPRASKARRPESCPDLCFVAWSPSLVPAPFPTDSICLSPVTAIHRFSLELVTSWFCHSGFRLLVTSSIPCCPVQRFSPRTSRAVDSALPLAVRNAPALSRYFLFASTIGCRSSILFFSMV
jgi:hypothetical protein